MNITFVLKGKLEGLPPILPRLLYTAGKGHRTRLICSSCEPSSLKILENYGISCYMTSHSGRILGKSSRFADWHGFRAGYKKIIASVCADTELLYICSADTALCLNNVLKEKKYIFQSNELYDRFPLYRYGIKKYVTNAEAFVIPEYCRANICRYWYGGNTPYFVIPNIPYIPSRERNQDIHNEAARKLIQKLEGKKLLIYQGHICAGDRSIDAIAGALRLIGNPDYALVLMGQEHDNSVSQLKSIYAQTYHIEFVPAPYHLEITSHAHIGLLSYDRASLNNIFCAPNKIYEYSALLLPMLGNDIPGLKYTVEYSGMGVCTAFEDEKNVADAIMHIEDNYDVFSKNAARFFDGADINAEMDRLMKYAAAEREN